MFVDCEFCVHSASITTSDASPPSRASNTISKATSSSGTTTTSATSSTLFRSLPPASSIISSFFPNCKSKRPGRAVPYGSQTDKGEVEQLFGCKCSDDLLHVSEDSCHFESTPSAEFEEKESNAKDSKHQGHESNDSGANQESPKHAVDTVHTLASPKYCHLESKIMPLSENSRNIEEPEGSDDDFEDCNSSISDTNISIPSQKSCDEDEELIESESQADVWSDAEEDMSQTNDIPGFSETNKTSDKNNFKSNSGRASPRFCINTISKRSFNLPENEGTNKKNVKSMERENYNEDGNISHCMKVGNLMSHSKEEERLRPQSNQTNIHRSLTEDEEKQTVINSCEEGNTKIASGNCSFPSTKNVVVDETKTDFEVCAHGIEMTSLCLLCLGYSKTAFWQKSDCTFRLKPDFQSGRSNEDGSNKRLAKKTEHLTSFANEKSVKVDSRSVMQLSCDSQKLSHAMAAQVTEHSQTLPRRRKSESSMRQKRNIVPPHKILPDGTVIYYWCDVPGGLGKSQNGMSTSGNEWYFYSREHASLVCIHFGLFNNCIVLTSYIFVWHNLYLHL